MSENNDSWAVVDLMGHVTVAGRITKPGEFGGLWQIDIPEGDSYRTEFFGSQSVYRVRIVSEEIARAYARPSHEVIEYDAPIITRQEHQEAMRKAEMQYYNLQREVSVLRNRLTAVNALPSGEAVEQLRALDGATVCRQVNHFYVDGICAECGSVEPPRQ